MKQISIDKLVSIAKEIHSKGKKWHFHMLTPKCQYNERKDEHAFVLENETDGEVYIAYSDERYMTQGKELVKLIHGDAITENTGSPPIVTNNNVKLMLKKAQNYNAQDIHWHHHMLFPNCIYNEHRGNWCIVFEDPETNDIIESVTKDEPTNDLRAIEILYYEQKK